MSRLLSDLRLYIDRREDDVRMLRFLHRELQSLANENRNLKQLVEERSRTVADWERWYSTLTPSQDLQQNEDATSDSDSHKRQRAQ